MGNKKISIRTNLIMIASFTIVSCLLILAQSKPLVREDWPSFDVVCPESEDGYAVFAPHPYDCSLYFECVGITPVLMSCPGDLEFDIQLNVCNWPELANCQPITTTTTTTTTSTTRTTTTEASAETTTEAAAETTTEAAAETTTEAAAETTTEAAA